jgi:hypothetical protein
MTKTITSPAELKPAFIVPQSALAKDEEARVFKKLVPILAEIRKTYRLKGYLLRNSTRVVADVDKREELPELAVLSAQLFSCSRKLINACNQGHMKSAVLEGSKMRILCLNIRGNQLSIFTEKTVDDDEIFEELTRVNI